MPLMLVRSEPVIGFKVAKCSVWHIVHDVSQTAVRELVRCDAELILAKHIFCRAAMKSSKTAGAHATLMSSTCLGL